MAYNVHAPYSTNLGLSDLPSDTDTLGIEKHCDGLTTFLRQCSSPMTIAIQGDWGTGKTSLMKQLEKNLKNNNGRTIWFNTWQFAVLGEQDRLLIDLLEVLCYTIKGNCSESQETDPKLRKILKFLKRVGRGATIGSISAIAETIKALSSFDATKVLDDIKAELKEQDETEIEIDNYNYESYSMMVSELRTDLEELVKMYLGENPRLYIFIDDLDRLEPIRAVELMEGLKNFLDIPQCVFVLAIDREVVETGLKQKYGKDFDNKKIIRFFDKIIQVPYELPIHNYNLEIYMKQILKDYDESNIEIYIDFLNKANIRNPRTIKRCVNLCLLHKCMDKFIENILDSDKDIFFHRYIVKMIELEEPENYHLIYNQAIESNENYDSMSDKLTELSANSRLINSVSNYFKLSSDKTNIEGIKLFAEYIKSAIPLYTGEYALLPYAERFIDIIKHIAYCDLAYSSASYNAIHDITDWRDLSYFQATELAQYIDKGNSFRLTFTNHAEERIIIDFNLHIKSKLLITIDTNLTKEVLFNNVPSIYVDNNSDEKVEHPSRSLCYYITHHGTKNRVNYHIFNINNTHSASSPIFKVLQNTGFIK